MPPKETRQARKRSPEKPKGEPSQQLQEQPHQAHHTRTHPTSSPSLSSTEVAEGLTKGASLTAKSLYSDQRTNTDTRPTALSTPPPSTHPESSSFGTRKSQKGRRLGSSASTARSPTLSSSAKATSKPFPRVTNGLALPAATLSSSALVAVESSSSTERIKSISFAHRSKARSKAPESAGNIWSQSLEDLEALQKVVVDGDHGSNPETDTELDKHQALDSERLPTSSMSEAPAVLPLQSNCYRMEFGGTIYKYGIICEPENVLAKRERRLVEKAFLQELCIGPQEGSIAFIDGHTFLTSKLYYGLDNYAFVGTINRRLDKPDQSFRPIFLKHDNEEAGKVTKVWSAFVRGTCLDNELVQKCMPSQNEQAKVGSQLIPVRAFAEVEEFDPATLRSPFNNKVGSQSEITRFTEALGCLLFRGNACGDTPTYSNSPSLVVHGSKVFDFTLPDGYLGYGLELRSGANSAIRTTPENILRAVLPCHRIFYRPVTVSNFIEEHLPCSIFTSTKVIATVQALLRGLKVRIQRIDREPRIVTISGIAKTTPGETLFELRNADGCRVISVLEYFSRNKGIRVTHSDHPCLVIGSDKRPQYLPTCVCEIIQGQSFRHPVPKEAFMKVDKFKSISAHKVNPSSDLCGDGNLVDLISQASSLGALSLHDGEAGHLSVLPEQVNCQKAVKPAAHLPLTLNTHLKGIFRVVFVELGNAPALSKTVEVFLKILERKLRDLRLGDSLSDGRTHTLKQSASVESWQEDLNDVLNPQMDLEKTDVACGGSTNLPRPLIVAFIEGGPENKQIHNKIKRLCDLRLGIQSCCVNLSTLDKIHEQDTDNGIDRYACSLLRKMFAKLENGLDDKDPDDRPVTPIRNATLLVGAHVVAVSAKPLTTKEPEVSFWPQVYCITLSSKPIGSNGTYKITTVLKRATDPEKLGLDILLSAHLDEHEKPRVQLSTLSRLLFYRSGAIAPNGDSTPRKPAPRAESQPEDRLPRNAISSRPNVSPALKGRVGSLTTGSSDSQHTKATNEAQRSWKITAKDGISIIAAPSRSTRRIATNISQGRDKMNDGFSRPLSNTPSLPPYAETDPPEPHNGFLETAERKNLFTKETERLESAISSKYPCARLFYISVSSNTKLRLYDTAGQPLVKDPPGPDKVDNNISWIVSNGLTSPNDNEWFILKELTGTNSQKPLQLSYHSLAAPGEGSSLENDMRKNYEDTFDASYDYPTGFDRCKMVAPVHFARLATKRALLLMDRTDNTSDTAPFKLRPVHSALRESLYYI